ncbi:MAG TPA: hypothetical protein VNN80_08580, partial [Polyangiaceae bacterium]|nr:hypothetical protein [Polyangiaceae bacterium]
MKPLDSSEGAAEGGSFDANGAAVRAATASDEEQGARSELSSSSVPAVALHRRSQVVPRGTAEDEAACEELEPARHSDVAPRPDASV